MNAAVTNNNNNTVAAPLARRVSGGASRRVAALTRGAPCRATSMPGTPTTKLKDLKNCIEAQQFDAEMLKELFVVADARGGSEPRRSIESNVLHRPHRAARRERGERHRRLARGEPSPGYHHWHP